MDSYQTLNDVIACHTFLQQSYSVRESVRADLVTEFIRIINIIRIQVESSANQMAAMTGHVTKHISLKEQSGFVTAVQTLKSLLGSSFDFSLLNNHADHELTGIMEKILFGGLIRYIPALLKVEMDMVSELEKIICILDYDKEQAKTLTDRNIPVSHNNDLCVNDIKKQIVENAVDAYCDSLNKLVITLPHQDK